jgi:endonuclease YncB( thermonuclease family)
MTLAAVALTLSSGIVYGDDPEFRGPYFGTVVRVIDGDTFEAKIEIWPTVSATVSVRLRGFDAPEISRTRCENEKALGEAAKIAMEELLPENQTVRLTNVGPDSFEGRVVAHVDRQVEVNFTSVGDRMLKEGHLRQWTPRDPAIDWCN